MKAGKFPVSVARHWQSIFAGHSSSDTAEHFASNAVCKPP